MNESKNWLDALSDGQLFRDWFSLIVHFFLGVGYFSFLIAGYSTALSLTFILIGIPLVLFMLGTTRTLARMDRQIMDAVLDTSTPEMEEDVDVRGANLGQRIGLYLGSGTTWRAALYLLAKFPIGLLSITVAMLILPLLALEVLILAPLTIDMRLISVRLLHWFAIGLHKGSGVLLPTTKKRKRDRNTERLESDEQAEPVYMLEDDGEIIVQKRFS
jgi:hypothetical protein